jgi:hypothetical protein
MFCNQHHPNHSGNKLWVGMFQTSLVNQSLVLSSLAIHKFCDECRRHLSSSCGDLSSMRTWSPFSLFFHHTHPCTIHPCSRYTHLVILQWLLPSTSIFSTTFNGWFASLPLRVLRPESRDEILFKGEGCDGSCTCKLGTLFVSAKYVLVSVKLVCVYVKLKKT